MYVYIMCSSLLQAHSECSTYYVEWVHAYTYRTVAIASTVFIVHKLQLSLGVFRGGIVPQWAATQHLQPTLFSSVLISFSANCT